jgi:hypothetical protein
MNTELDKLRKEFLSLDTDEQRAEFDRKFKKIIAGKSETELASFREDFIRGAKEACDEAERIIDEAKLNKELKTVYGVVS